MSKEEILENYLNVINLANGCYGVVAAAEYYFSKDTSTLTLLEWSASVGHATFPSLMSYLCEGGFWAAIVPEKANTWYFHM